ncbi:Alpha/Beta hydrolase protein [Flagelloscypha sp. PMI_526]|nr:Alpha/Beta hydrolase protein [Flagelloscypha sp. PMI_526]
MDYIKHPAELSTPAAVPVAPPIMNLSTLSLPSGIQYTYYDTGPPAPNISIDSARYPTLFTVHGLAFNAFVWKPMFPFAKEQGIRLVSINRRGYGGSSPLTKDEANLFASNPTKSVDERGEEILNFIHVFVQQENIPLLEAGGGFGLVAWSLGALTAIAGIANLENAIEPIRETFKKGFKSFVLHEPTAMTIDIATPCEFFSPLKDSSIPAKEKRLFLSTWITSYFDHPSLETRSTDSLVTAAPSQSLAPTIYNIPGVDKSTLFLQNGGLSYDGAAFANTTNEGRRANFRKAIQTGTPVAFVIGEKTLADHISAGWAVEEEAKNQTWGATAKIGVHFVPGVNHLGHWNHPDVILKAYLKGAGFSAAND